MKNVSLALIDCGSEFIRDWPVQAIKIKGVSTGRIFANEFAPTGEHARRCYRCRPVRNASIIRRNIASHASS
jgi:hypothetical protein